MKIGIISDTHNRLNPKIFKIFEGLPIIIHAGDVGHSHILIELNAIPGVEQVYAVLGNTDDPWELSGVPTEITLTLGNYAILVRHIVDSPEELLQNLRRQKKEMPEIVIFGHTHQPYFQAIDSVYFLNPGSASLPRQSPAPSVAILDLTQRPPQATFIYL